MKENHWYRKAKVGVFFHWGIENGKRADEFEEKAGNWNAKVWVDAAKRLHADYITLATFHSDFSWLVTWKTDIPGLNTTKRDFLRELIDAAEKENIKVIVYITSATIDSKGEAAKNCIDYEAYCDYKGIAIDSSSYLDFQGILAKEIILELMDNYPEVAGFWYDGWNDKAVCEDVFAAVHAKNPDAVNIRNNFYKEPYKDEDVMAQECLGKVYSPYYDKASASWLESGVPSEWDYMPFGQWDTVGENTPVPCNISDEMKHFTSVMANGWVAKIGLASKIDGTFEPFMYDYMEKMDEFITWSGEAFRDVKTGGFIGGGWNCGAYGFTTKRADKDEYYICVTTAPENGGYLSLINNGFDICSVINLKNGCETGFECDDDNFVIKYNNWSQKKPVEIFKVIAKKKPVAFTCAVNPNESLPCKIHIELEKDEDYLGIEIIHKESSAIEFGAWGGQSSQRPKKYRIIETSTNNILTEGEWKNQRGGKWISLKNITAKDIFLEIVSAYDTYEKSYAANWRCGFKDRLEDVIDICSNSKGIIQYINSKNELWERNSVGDRKLMENVKRVICGKDDMFYHINTDLRAMEISINEKIFDLAVAEDGAAFFVTLSGILKNRNDDIIAKNVKSISMGDDILYIAGDCTYKYMYNKHELEVYKMPYNAVSIAALGSDAAAVTTPTGKIHYVNDKGDNSFIMGYDAARVNAGNDKTVWYVSKTQSGKVNIVDMSLIKK